MKERPQIINKVLLAAAISSSCGGGAVRDTYHSCPPIKPGEGPVTCVEISRSTGKEVVPQKTEAAHPTKTLIREESLKLAKLLIAGNIDPYLNALAPSVRQTYVEGNQVTLGSLRESLSYFRESCKNPQLDLQRIKVDENITGPIIVTSIYFQQTCPPYDRVSKNPIEGIAVQLRMVDGKPTPLTAGPFSH